MDYLKDISDLVVKDNITYFTYKTKDVVRANLLRRSLLSEIETYTIDVVIFYINTSPRMDEVLAFRFGQLVIDQTENEQLDNVKTSIDLEGPLEVTTDNIPDLKFAYTTPIVVLREGQRLVCDLITKKGKAKTHAKWRPFAQLAVKEDKNIFRFSYKNIGMLSDEEIIKQGLARMIDAANNPPTSIFWKPFIPKDF